MKPQSHAGWVPQMQRTMWSLCRRLLRKHKDIMHRKQNLHSLINSSFALITGGVTKIHLVWALPASSKTLLLAFCPYLNLNQLNLSVWTIKSFLTVLCDGLVKLWETELMVKHSSAAYPRAAIAVLGSGACSQRVAGGVLQNVPSWLGDRVPRTGKQSNLTRWAVGERTSHRSRLNFKGSTRLTGGQRCWQRWGWSCPGALALEIGKRFKLISPLFCHQRARLPSLPGTASASKGTGLVCGSLMSFFSHFSLNLLFSLLAGPKALSEKKKVAETFCRGERECS